MCVGHATVVYPQQGHAAQWPTITKVSWAHFWMKLLVVEEIASDGSHWLLWRKRWNNRKQEKVQKTFPPLFWLSQFCLKKVFFWRIRNRFKIKRNEKFFPTFSNQKKTYFPKSLFKPTSDSNLSAFRIHCLKLNCAATSAPNDGTPDAVLSQLRLSKVDAPFIFVYGYVLGMSFGLKSFGLKSFVGLCTFVAFLQGTLTLILNWEVLRMADLQSLPVWTRLFWKWENILYAEKQLIPASKSCWGRRSNQ